MKSEEVIRVRAGYKDSGEERIGAVPENWHIKRIKYLSNLCTSRATTTEFPVALENIEPLTGRLLETDTTYENDGLYFQPGDLLFGKLRVYQAKVLLADRCGEAVGDLFVLRPTHKVDGKYFQYQLLDSAFIAVADGSTFGAKMPRVSWDFLGNMRLPHPPLIEQKAIAAFLDRETSKIDTLIEKQQRLVTLLTEKRQAVISHAVTKGLDTTIPMKDTKMGWLGRVPAHWDIKRIKYLSNLCTSRATTTEFPVALENIEPLTGRLLETDTTYENDGLYFQPGDLLFGKLRVYQAKVLLADRCGEAVGDLFVLRPTHKVDGKYFQYQLLDSAFIAVADGSTFGAKMPRVSWDFLGNMRLPHPPLIEQKAIAAFLDRETAKIDNLIGKANQSIDLMKERRSALISAAVTGKIDVRQAI